MAAYAPSADDPDAEIAWLKDRIAQLEADQARLRDSEKMYRFSAEVSGRLVWSTNPEGRVVTISRLFSVVTGLPEEQALHDGWIQGVHPRDRGRIRRLWSHALATGEPFEAEFRGRLADGSYRLGRARALPLRDRGGNIVRWFGSCEDIQQERAAEQARRQAEERLRESEALYRHTLELSQQIAWTADERGRLLTLTARFWRVTGLKRSEGVLRAVHPDDVGPVVARWRDSVARGHAYNAQCRLRVRDGGYRYFRIRAAPRRDKQGQVLRWYGTAEDVHLQLQADFARRDVEERYRLAVQATNDAVWDYDIVGGTIDWSDNAGAIFGSDRPIGRTGIDWWEARVHPEDRAIVAQSLADAIEEGASRWSATYRFLKLDGAYGDMLDRGFIIRSADGTAIRAVGAMADLTDRHRAEAEIRRMQSELVHVSRLSAMGTMASTLAHELNQPLTAVTNYVSGAKRIAARGGEADGDRLLEALEAAESGALRAGEIVRRLRELVSRGTVAVRIEHLPRMIEDAGVVGFVDERLLGINHRIELDPEAEWVRCDRIQIQQVMINLIRNAADALQESPGREIVISTHAQDGMAEIRVADSGPGIAPEHMDSLFSQFMTTKSGGMGIGLPISRTIVEAHGGKIWAENRPEGGAVFCFTLPAAPRHKPPL